MGHAAHPAPATRPALEVAHILREEADAYRETHRLSAQQQRVVNALVSCRTAALGGFKSHCNHCGAETIQYASCRNRHCPKCQDAGANPMGRAPVLRPPRHRPLACRVHLASRASILSPRAIPRSSTACCSTPPRRPSSSSDAIPGGSGANSASPWCSTPGGRISRSTSMSTASLPTAP